MSRMVGDYDYRGCEIAGVKFSVILNGDVIERIRRIESGGNPIIWKKGEPMTDEVLQIIRLS
jgi:hypothetical protein